MATTTVKKSTPARKTAAKGASAPKAAPPAPIDDGNLNVVISDPPQDAVLADFARWHAAGGTGTFTFGRPVTIDTLRQIGALVRRRAPGAPGFRATHADADVITVLAETNPRQAGSKAHARFALFQSGMTVGAYLAACQQKLGENGRGSVSKAVRRGWIRVEKPA
jgi:hypothetical protein